MKFVTKPHDITHRTLGVLLHYLEKLKIQFLQISSDNTRYGRKCKQIAY